MRTLGVHLRDRELAPRHPRNGLHHQRWQRRRCCSSSRLCRDRRGDEEPVEAVEHYVCVDGPVDFAPLTKISSARAMPPASRFGRTPDDVAFLIYTSGTTGRPEGRHAVPGGQIAAAEILGSDQRNSPADRLLIMMPLVSYRREDHPARPTLARRHRGRSKGIRPQAIWIPSRGNRSPSPTWRPP